MLAKTAKQLAIKEKALQRSMKEYTGYSRELAAQKQRHAELLSEDGDGHEIRKNAEFIRETEATLQAIKKTMLSMKENLSSFITDVLAESPEFAERLAASQSLVAKAEQIDDE